MIFAGGVPRRVHRRPSRPVFLAGIRMPTAAVTCGSRDGGQQFTRMPLLIVPIPFALAPQSAQESHPGSNLRGQL
jgi:hypothetical protein